MRWLTLAAVFWFLAASAHAQKTSAAKPSGSEQTHARKRSTAAKPHATRAAAHEHSAPKAEAAPKPEPTKKDAAPDKPSEAKAVHAESAPRLEAQPAPAAAQASDDVRKEGDTQVKMMEFSGLDIEGQLKTPQMLYFLNRLRAEFGHPRLPHRSFMPDLERSTKEGSF
jgi:hypothetical protein